MVPGGDDGLRAAAELLVSHGPIVPADHEGRTLTFTPPGDGTHVDWLSNYTHSGPRSSLLAILDGRAKPLAKQ